MTLYGIDDLVDSNGQLKPDIVLHKYSGYIVRKVEKWGFIRNMERVES